MIDYDALVIGSGFSGLGTALALAAKHYSVLILEHEPEPGGLLKDVCRGLKRLEPLLDLIHKNQRIRLVTGATITSIGGFHPRFGITWLHAGTLHHADAGHIVFAMGLEMRFPLSILPDGPGRPGVSLLPQLETRVCDDAWTSFSGQRIVMVCGYNEPVYPYSMHLFLDRSLALARHGARVVLTMPDLLFHRPDTPEQYRQCREHGVLFIHSPHPPIITGTPPDMQFETIDPALADGERPAWIHGTVDHVILEPEYRPRTLKNIFWSPHHPSTASTGFYGSDHPAFARVHTERKGVFTVGAVTGFKSLEDCREEVALAVSDIMIHHPENPSYAEVDEKKCVVCLTCVRICPHRAIAIDGKAIVARDACDGCGICVAECPASAIRLIRPGIDSFAAGTIPMPDHLPEWAVLICCDGSTGPAWDSVRPNPVQAAFPLHVLRVPCSGRITVSGLLEHLKRGAAGVLVAACPLDCCDHIHGNRLAMNRVNRVRAILQSLQMDPDRVQMITVAQGMTTTLIRAVETFCTHIFSGQAAERDPVGDEP